MKRGFSTQIFRSAPVFFALFLTVATFTVRAQPDPTRIEYDVLNREQRGLRNVLTDGETDLGSAQTRLLNNSLVLSAQDAARAAIKVAHLRAMAQLHPERCARTTGHFLATAGFALSDLTNSFFGNIKPRIVRLEDNLNTYVSQLRRIDPNLAAQLQQIIEAANASASANVWGQADSKNPIIFNESKILKDVPQNQIAPPGSSGSSGGSGYNGPGTSGSGSFNYGPGSSGSYSGGGADFRNMDPRNYSGVLRDTHGNILDKATFRGSDPTLRVEVMTSDKGILTREQKFNGKFVKGPSGEPQWSEGDPKTIDWQFDIEASEKGFTLVDRSGGADEDKGFNVEKWAVVDPSGKSTDFPGSAQLNYPMTTSGTYKVTATVKTKLDTRFNISTNPSNN